MSIAYKSTERIQAGLLRSDDLGKTKVHYLQIGVIWVVNHEDVLWFQISVADTERVQVVQSGSDLVSNSLCSGLSYCELSLL